MFLFFTTLVFFLILRLYYIQILKGDFYKQGAFFQKTGTVTEKVRGDILDRNGESLTGSYTVDYAIISWDWLSVSEKITYG